MTAASRPSSVVAATIDQLRQAPGPALRPDPDQVARVVRAVDPVADAATVERTVQAVLVEMSGLGALTPFLDDDRVSDVLVNGDGSVWIERDGGLQRSGLHLDHRATRAIIERIAAGVGRRIDRSTPMVDARLPDGSRVHAVVPPLAVDGPCLSIRRFRARPLGLDAFAGAAVGELLARSVAEGRNILVSGGTGAGKTSLLNALAATIPPSTRVVTVEDAAELRLPLDHVVRLETRDAGPEGPAPVTVRDLVRTALRMRPDRIIVGEVRGPEALDMLQAMNTGHEGSLGTVHANSPTDALARLETMTLAAGSVPLAAVRRQIRASVDLVVQVRRTAGARRRIHQVAEPDPRGGLRLLVDGDTVTGQPVRPARTAVAS